MQTRLGAGGLCRLSPGLGLNDTARGPGAIQVGMLQALAEKDVLPDVVAGTSVGALNGSVVALDPRAAANRLSHAWARMTRERVFAGGLAAQARMLPGSTTSTSHG